MRPIGADDPATWAAYNPATWAAYNDPGRWRVHLEQRLAALAHIADEYQRLWQEIRPQ